jgi:hypothetical protein
LTVRIGVLIATEFIVHSHAMKKAFCLAFLALSACLPACGKVSTGGAKQVFLLSPPSDSTLPDGTVNVPYTATFQLLSGGKAPYSFGAVALPPGLNLTTTSGTSFVISGTPTQAGSGVLQVQVADASQNVEIESYALTINPAALSVAPATIAPFLPNKAYSQTLSTNGQPPIIWSVSGALPTGVVLQSSASTVNVLAGTPTAPGQFTFTIVVNDANGAAGSQTYSVFVP